MVKIKIKSCSFVFRDLALFIFGEGGGSSDSYSRDNTTLNLSIPKEAATTPTGYVESIEFLANIALPLLVRSN